MYTDSSTGLSVIVAHATTVIAALILLSLHVALGAEIRQRIRATGRDEASWRWPVDAALGAGAFALLLLPIAAAGQLRSSVVLVVTAACAILVRRRLLRTASELVEGVRAITRVGEVNTRSDTVARSLVALLFVLMIAAAVAPPTEWDSLMYHLRIPLGILEHGQLSVPVDSFHVALIGGAHLATLPLLAAGLVSGPAVMQVAALGLTLLGTFSLARAAGGGRASRWMAAAILFGSPMFLLVAITARVDVALVATLVAAHLALLDAGDRDDARALIVAALLVGFGMAIKPQAGAFAIALIPAGWRAARTLRSALVAAAIAATVSAPWYLKNLLLVGAPLYPKGAPGWFEPWISELFGGRVRPERIDASILQALPEARASFDVLDAFFAPGNLTIEGEGAFYALSPVLLLLPLVALRWRSRPQAAAMALAALAYAALVVVPFGQINLRYLMPAIPALAVAVAVASESLTELMRDRLGRTTRLILVTALAMTALAPLWGAVKQRFFRADFVLLRHAIGLESAEGVWRRHPDGTVRALAPALANVSRLVPPDGKVLLLWEARGLAFDREVLVDVMLSNWSYLEQSPALENCLAGTGITHILAGTGAINYYVARGADAEAFRLNGFASFRDRCLSDHAFVGPGFEFFAVRRPER